MVVLFFLLLEAVTLSSKTVCFMLMSSIFDLSNLTTSDPLLSVVTAFFNCSMAFQFEGPSPDLGLLFDLRDSLDHVVLSSSAPNLNFLVFLDLRDVFDLSLACSSSSLDKRYFFLPVGPLVS